MQKHIGYTYFDKDRQYELFNVMENECFTFQNYLLNELYIVDIVDNSNNIIQSSGLIPSHKKALDIANNILNRCENFSYTFNSNIFDML